MNIVVCVKQVPDTSARKELGPDFRLNRSNLDSVINPFDEYAIEAGLRLKEGCGGEVTILSMGPPSAEDTIRKALAMGADKGILVTDPSLEGTDWLGTCQVLVAALSSVKPDLVITGMESTDARGGLVPGGIAELLAYPLLSYAAKVDIQDQSVCIRRQVAGGYQEIEASLPVVVSVVKGANDPRYPSLKGIMAAKKKQIARMSVADLDVDRSGLGLAGAKTRVTSATPRAERTPAQALKPDTAEEAAHIIAEFLQARKFI